MIDKVPPHDGCVLAVAAEPLQWISDHLSRRVQTFKDEAVHLCSINELWKLQLSSGKILFGRKIILAVGGKAKELQFPTIPTISLTTALHPGRLKESIQADDYVAVFGSAQSAKSVIQNLSKIKTKKVVLFYLFDRQTSLNQ